MLALMIFTNLPYIYSAHDLVLLKGKKPFYSLPTALGSSGLWEDGEVPREVLVAVQNGSCFNHQTSGTPADSRHCGMSLWSWKASHKVVYPRKSSHLAHYGFGFS